MIRQPVAALEAYPPLHQHQPQLHLLAHLLPPVHPRVDLVLFALPPPLLPPPPPRVDLDLAPLPRALPRQPHGRLVLQQRFDALAIRLVPGLGIRAPAAAARRGLAVEQDRRRPADVVVVVVLPRF